MQGSGLNTLKGKVQVLFDKRVDGRWKTAHKYTKSVSQGVRVTVTLEKARWRLRVLYGGSPGYLKSAAKPVTFRV